MKKACPYCGRIHDKRNECGRAPVRHKRFSDANNLRNKGAWKKVKKLANDRDGNMCVLCFLEGAFNVEELETHHIVPINDDPELAYELENLVTVCRRHHEIVEALPPGEVHAMIEGAVNPRRPREKEKFPK